MKKLLLPLLVSLTIYSSLSIAASEMYPWNDNILSISDFIYFFNVMFGAFWTFWKSAFLLIFYSPSVIFIGSLIDTPFGSFLELPTYGYTAATYLSLAYWIGGYFLIDKLIKKDDSFALFLFFYGLLVIGFIGGVFEWWGDSEFILRLTRMEYLECFNVPRPGDFEFVKCIALF